MLTCGAVDGLVTCEEWSKNIDDASEELKRLWLRNRVAGKNNRNWLHWPYPFLEEEMFVLTLSAGLEGYHFHVDGKHVTSFPYRVVSGASFLNHLLDLVYACHVLVS